MTYTPSTIPKRKGMTMAGATTAGAITAGAITAGATTTGPTTAGPTKKGTVNQSITNQGITIAMYLRVSVKDDESNDITNHVVETMEHRSMGDASPVRSTPLSSSTWIPTNGTLDDRIKAQKVRMRQETQKSQKSQKWVVS